MTSLQLPPELALRGQTVARNRKLADAMWQAGMQKGQGQMVGGFYIPESGFHDISRGIQLLAAGKANTAADAEEKQISADYSKGLASAVQNYMTTREGQSGQTMSDGQAQNLMENNIAPQLADGVKADPRKALVDAMASGYAPLHDLAKIELTQRAKLDSKQETFSNPVTEKDPTSGALVSVQYGNLGTRRPVQGAVPFERPMSVADRVVDVGTPSKVIVDYSKTGGATETIGGDLYQRMSDNTLKKLDNSPKIAVTTHAITNGQKAGMSEWAKGAAKTVNDLGDAARSSVQLSSALQQLDKLSTAGVYGGPTAAPAMWISGLSKAAGLPVDASKLANSEAYSGFATEAVQKLISQYGGNRGVTASEAEQIKQVIPQLQQSPEARKMLTQILQNVSARNIQDFKDASSSFNRAIKADDPTLFDFTPTMLPNEAAAAQVQGSPTGKGSPMPLADYLKLKGAR